MFKWGAQTSQLCRKEVIYPSVAECPGTAANNPADDKLPFLSEHRSAPGTEEGTNQCWIQFLLQEHKPVLSGAGFWGLAPLSLVSLHHQTPGWRLGPFVPLPGLVPRLREPWDGWQGWHQAQHCGAQSDI